MAEGGGLLNRYRGNTPIVGSNPIPSATLLLTSCFAGLGPRATCEAISSNSAERRDHGFDREKQGPTFGWVFDELRASHIESLRCLILGVDEHCANPDAL